MDPEIIKKEIPLTADIKLKDIIYPVYIWKNSKHFVMTMRMKVAVDAFIETKSLNKACERVREMMSQGIVADTLKAWLCLENVKEYIAQVYKDRGILNAWSKERWLGRMTEHMIAVGKINEIEENIMQIDDEVEKLRNLKEHIPHELIGRRQSLKIELPFLKSQVLKNSDLYCMKLIGDSLGYFLDSANMPQFNQTINIVQRNGRE